MAKATKLRQEEKAKNTETISDAEEAQTAVAQALTVLKEFYAKAAEATALLQTKAEPEIFDSPYKGMQSENGRVVLRLVALQELRDLRHQRVAGVRVREERGDGE